MQTSQTTTTVEISFSENYFLENIQPFLNEWRLKSTRDKLMNWLLSCVWLQDNFPKKGHKYAMGLPVIEIGDKDISTLFRDIHSQTKFRRLVRQYRIARPDGSWVAKNISDKGNPVRCNAWHFMHRDALGKNKVKFAFDPYNATHGIHAVMVDAIAKAEGTVVNDKYVFNGAWAVEDWKAGKLTWDDLKEVYKTALLCKRTAKEVDFRTYDAISLSKKEVRSRCFRSVSDGQTIAEVVDFNAAALACSVVASVPLFKSKKLTGFGKLNDLNDETVLRLASRLHFKSEEDAYKAIWEEARSMDPHSGALPRKWTPSARKTVKNDMTILLNYSTEEIAACRTAYLMNFRRVKTQINKRRQWLLWTALKRVNPTAWTVAQACRMTGQSNLFFLFYTCGEKILIERVQKYLASKGVETTRVHDALWSSDARVKKATKEEQKAWSNKMIANAIFESYGIRNKNDLSVKSCIAANTGTLAGYDKLLKDGCGKVTGARKIVEALATLTEDQKRMLRKAMRVENYYCEESFPATVEPSKWLLVA